MTTRALQRLLVTASILFVLVFSGCGGGSGGSEGGGSTPNTPSQLVVTTTSLPSVLQGQSDTQTLEASGGTPPYSWSVATNLGSFPPGMILSTAGVLSGTLTQFGSYLLVVQVKDSGSPAQTATGKMTFVVAAPLSITPNFAVIPSGINIGTSFTDGQNATGGIGPYSWSLQAGSGPMPQGWSLTPSTFAQNGLLAFLGGTATSSGTYTFTVQLSDPGPPAQTATKTYSVTITNNLLIGNQGTLLAVVSKPFDTTLVAYGGTPPYTWSLGSFAPSWVALNSSTGEIRGTPPQQRDYFFTVNLTDSAPTPHTVQGNFDINAQPQLAFTSTVMNDFVLGYFSMDSVPFDGGISPYTIQAVSGTLPPGIAPSGTALQGTATTAGTYTFGLQVSDSETPPATVQQNFTLHVNPLLHAVYPGNDLPNGLQGQPYSFTFQSTGGLAPLTWSLIEPTGIGLSINPASGVLSGVPTQPYHLSAEAQVTDSSNPPQTSFATGNLLILGSLGVSTSKLPTVSVNSPVSLQLAAVGGIGQYTWTQISGALPAGLNFNATSATISGQTSQTGTFPLTFQVSDPGPPAQVSAPVTLQLVVGSNLGRNDSPATATPLSNGTFQASISPFSDPPTGAANPDSDYYQITANPGATVTINISAQRLTPPSPLDSVLELVDINGTQLQLCSSSPSQPVNPFTQACMNDDISGVLKDSQLFLQVPATNTGPLTFYAHVLDFRGDARPDFIYTITISGAN